MWTLALSFLGKFWKHLVVLLAVLALIAWVRHAWNERFEDGYDEGVRVTEEAQATIIAQRMLENEKRERELRNQAATMQAELEGKANANAIIADTLRDQLLRRRVCTDDEVRREPMPSASATAGSGDGAASDQGPAQTVGDRIVEIVEQCQRSTDKLLTLQEWVRSSAR